jgi:glycerophosphoryl diester phosphodiesterase
MSSRIPEIITQRRPLVIAHRGFSMAAPENTEAAFRLALLAQPDLVELDFYHSSDGVPVVFHDRTYDRTTDAKARWGEEKVAVGAKPFAAIRQLDNGAWFARPFAGSRVLTLEEALDVIQPGAVTLIEQKEGDARTLFDLLTRKEMLEDVFVQSFNWDFVADFHALAPQVPLGALGPPAHLDGRRLETKERALSLDFLDRVQKVGASVAGWNQQVDAETIAEAHRRGLRVWTYVINDLDTAKRMLDLEVDGLISDNPAMAWKAVALSAASWGQVVRK